MAYFGVLIFGVCFIFACLILELLLINQNKTTSKITQFTVFQFILNCGPRGSNSFFTRILVLRINCNNIATNGSSEDLFFFSIVAQIKIIELIVQTPSTRIFLCESLNLQATNDDS
jgi:dolichyl-phosphate-mannose--protein O-mannosyl transferase